MFEIVGLSVELLLTGLVFMLVIKIIERIDKIEKTINKTLHREKVQVRVFESKKTN